MYEFLQNDKEHIGELMEEFYRLSLACLKEINDRGVGVEQPKFKQDKLCEKGVGFLKSGVA